MYIFPIFPELANLVDLAVKCVNETGTVITNITTDNATSNVAMLNLLGARLTDMYC